MKTLKEIAYACLAMVLVTAILLAPAFKKLFSYPQNPYDYED